jgi:hypothetical protein
VSIEAAPEVKPEVTGREVDAEVDAELCFGDSLRGTIKLIQARW